MELYKSKGQTKKRSLNKKAISQEWDNREWWSQKIGRDLWEDTRSLIPQVPGGSGVWWWDTMTGTSGLKNFPCQWLSGMVSGLLARKAVTLLWGPPSRVSVVEQYWNFQGLGSSWQSWDDCSYQQSGCAVHPNSHLCWHAVCSVLSCHSHCLPTSPSEAGSILASLMDPSVSALTDLPQFSSRVVCLLPASLNLLSSKLFTEFFRDF